MSSFENVASGDESLSFWAFGHQLLRDEGFDDGFQGATTGAIPNNGPENGTASPFNQVVPPAPTTGEQALSGASQEHGLDGQVRNGPNNGANNGVVSEIVSSFLAGFGAQQPAASANGGAGVQDFFLPEPAEHLTAGPYTGFVATIGQEIEYPLQAQQADDVQQSATLNDAGANMLPPQQPDLPAWSPAVANTGLVPFAGQEMQVAQSANPLKRKYGEHPLAPWELPQENGRYRPVIKRGAQKNPKSSRVGDEPEQRHDSVQAEQSVDDQEPTVDTPPPAKRPKNREGAIPGRQQAIKYHKRHCHDPVAGCEADCELREKHFDKFEKLRKKKSKFCPHLPPKYQIELWEHIPPSAGYVPQ